MSVWKFLVKKKIKMIPQKPQQTSKQNPPPTSKAWLFNFKAIFRLRRSEAMRYYFCFFGLMTVNRSNSVCVWTVLAVHHGSLPSFGSQLTETGMCYWQSGFFSGDKH